MKHTIPEFDLLRALRTSEARRAIRARRLEAAFAAVVIAAGVAAMIFT